METILKGIGQKNCVYPLLYVPKSWPRNYEVLKCFCSKHKFKTYFLVRQVAFQSESLFLFVTNAIYMQDFETIQYVCDFYAFFTDNDNFDHKTNLETYLRAFWTQFSRFFAEFFLSLEILTFYVLHIKDYFLTIWRIFWTFSPS